jgi:hypothetical protein
MIVIIFLYFAAENFRVGLFSNTEHCPDYWISSHRVFSLTEPECAAKLAGIPLVLAKHHASTQILADSSHFYSQFDFLEI